MMDAASRPREFMYLIYLLRDCLFMTFFSILRSKKTRRTDRPKREETKACLFILQKQNTSKQNFEATPLDGLFKEQPTETSTSKPLFGLNF